MTEAEAIAKLDEIAARGGGDPESSHSDADSILLELVGEKVFNAYERVVASCSWWACA